MSGGFYFVQILNTVQTNYIHSLLSKNNLSAKTFHLRFLIVNLVLGNFSLMGFNFWFLLLLFNFRLERGIISYAAEFIALK